MGIASPPPLTPNPAFRLSFHFLRMQYAYCIGDHTPGKPYRKETRELFRTLFHKRDDSADLLDTDASSSVYNPVDGYRAMSNLLREENSTKISEKA